MTYLAIHIRPCLLGFAVHTRMIGPGHSPFTHDYILPTFHDVLWALLNTPDDYRLTLG